MVVAFDNHGFEDKSGHDMETCIYKELDKWW